LGDERVQHIEKGQGRYVLDARIHLDVIRQNRKLGRICILAFKKITGACLERSRGGGVHLTGKKAED
jgi:hypothetical protein